MKRVLLLSCAFLTLAFVSPVQAKLANKIAEARSATPIRMARRQWGLESFGQKRTQAEADYRHVWNRVSNLYGQEGKPPPPVVFGKPPPGDAGYAGPGQPVTLQPSVVRWLTRPTVNDQSHRDTADTLLLHEWAHEYQEPRLLADPNQAHKEEAAQLFATYYAHKLFGAPAEGDYGKPPYANRPASSQDLASAYGKGYWRRGQFGLNP